MVVPELGCHLLGRLGGFGKGLDESQFQRVR